MRLTALPILAAGLLFAGNAAAQYETPTATATPATSEPSVTATPEATPTPAPAPEKPKPEVTTGAVKLKVGGTIWPFYRFDMTEGAQDRNEFDVGRAYLSVYPTVSDTVDGRITIDVVPQGGAKDSTDADVNTNTTGSLMMRLKYGYLAYHPIGPMLDLQAGMIQTPWIAYEEDIWGYRVLGETAAAQYWGIKSADFGYGAKLKLLNDRLLVWTQVQNGETYAKRETNKYKESQTLVSFQVLPAKEGGLKVGAFYSYGLTDQDADKVRGIGMVSWQSAMFMAEAGYLMASTGDGAGTHVEGGGPWIAGYVNVPFSLPTTAGTRVVARVDMADPNTDPDVKDDSVTRLTAGVALRLAEKSQVIFDYQQESYENADLDPVKLGFVHWDLSF